MPRRTRAPHLRGVLVAVGLTIAVAVVVGVRVGRTAAEHPGVPQHEVKVVNRVVRLSRPGSLYWGASIDTSHGQAPWSAQAVSSFEKSAGKSMSIIAFASPFYSDVFCTGFCEFQPGTLDLVRAHGAIPMITWGPNWKPSIDALVASGAYDTYLTQWAQAAKAWGHPFFLRFAQEMNGGWFAWSIGAEHNTAASYVAMWRHVHDIFTRVGATNATWVWCPNVLGRGISSRLQALYPGDAYVGWTCLDGYNSGVPWRSFGTLYGPTYSQITNEIAPNKPMIIGEVASTEDGGSKSDWITNMFTTLPDVFPKVRAFVWAEDSTAGPGGRTDWEIESSPQSAASFAAGVSSPLYKANQFANLPSGPIQPPN
jgi:Glycosyl hydrolase family 26